MDNAPSEAKEAVKVTQGDLQTARDICQILFLTDIADPHAHVAAIVARVRDEAEKRIVDRVREAMSTGYPAPPNKVDRCEHGKFGWEDCIACYDDFLDAALTGDHHSGEQ